MSRLHIAVIALAIAIPICGLGAGAFNPDSGIVIHSLVLYEIFGITFEVGLPLLVVLGIASVVRGVWSGRRSRNG
jgi:hypothetical protein